MSSVHPIGSSEYKADCEECTEKILAHFASISSTLSEADKLFLTRSTILRYSTARNAHYDEALKNLESSLEWRRTHVPDHLCCPACEQDPGSHCFFTIGVDSKKRIVVYASAAKAKMNEKDVTVQHMVHVLEHAWRSTNELDLAPQWTWIIDFGGFSLWNAMQGSTSNGALSAFSRHMPERLGVVCLLNPPGIFDILLAAVKPFVDARTMSKVHFLRGTPEDVSNQLDKLGISKDSGMASWLTECLHLPVKTGNVPNDSKLDTAILQKIRLPGCAHIAQNK